MLVRAGAGLSRAIVHAHLYDRLSRPTCIVRLHRRPESSTAHPPAVTVLSAPDPCIQTGNAPASTREMQLRCQANLLSRVRAAGPRWSVLLGKRMHAPRTRPACEACRMDLEVSRSLTIPAAELGWRFSRSSGPGGQHVNTSDSRVELSWSVADSLVLSDDQRRMLLSRLERRLVGGVVTVVSSERRSQLRNREAALEKLADIVRTGLAPPGPKRRPTKPTKGSQRRRLESKGQRSATKAQRKRPSAD